MYNIKSCSKNPNDGNTMEILMNGDKTSPNHHLLFQNQVLDSMEYIIRNVVDPFYTRPTVETIPGGTQVVPGASPSTAGNGEFLFYWGGFEVKFSRITGEASFYAGAGVETAGYDLVSSAGGANISSNGFLANITYSPLPSGILSVVITHNSNVILDIDFNVGFILNNPASDITGADAQDSSIVINTLTFGTTTITASDFALNQDYQDPADTLQADGSPTNITFVRSPDSYSYVKRYQILSNSYGLSIFARDPGNLDFVEGDPDTITEVPPSYTRFFCTPENIVQTPMPSGELLSSFMRGDDTLTLETTTEIPIDSKVGKFVDYLSKNVYNTVIRAYSCIDQTPDLCEGEDPERRKACFEDCLLSFSVLY